jgi:branched-chain amino acid transport system substrate-binding protein
MRSARNLFAALTVLLVSVVFSACASGDPGNTPTIATLFPQSGESATIGLALQQGVDLAVQQNANLGHGYTLSVRHADATSNPSGVMQQIASDNQVVGVVGPFDDTTATTVIPLAIKNHLALISPTNSLPGLTLADQAQSDGLTYTALHPAGSADTYFRLPANALAEGKAAATLATTGTTAGGLGAQSAYIVDDGTTSGKALAAAFNQAFTAKHDTVAGHMTITVGSNDNTQAVVTAIIEAEPDVVYYAGGAGNGGAQLRSALSLSGVPQLAFLAGDQIADDPGWAPAVGLPAAASSTWSLVSAPDPSTLKDATAQSVISAFHSAFPNAQLLPQTLMAYDAAMVEITALKSLIAAGKSATRSNLVSAIGTTSYTGVTGAIAFDQNGDNKAPAGFSVYACDANGKWSYKKSIKV